MTRTPVEYLELDHRDPVQAEQIRRVFFDAYSVEAELIGVAGFPPLRRTAHDIRTAGSVFSGCRYDGSLVAVAEIEWISVQQADIAGFAVHPSMFRRGIGSGLLRHVLATLQAPATAEGTLVTVSTATGNKPAIALYESLGFCVARHWATKCNIAMVTMSRTVSRVGEGAECRRSGDDR